MKLKSLTIVIFFVLLTAISFGQSKKTTRMLKEIQNEWTLDENNKVSYQRILEIPNLTKDQLYHRMLTYFVDNQVAEYDFQTKDKDKGVIYLKSVFENIHDNGRGGMLSVNVDCLHSLKVEIKEKRVRLTLTLVLFDILDSINYSNRYKKRVEDSFPVNPLAESKTITGKSFYKSHLAAIQTLDKIEKMIKTVGDLKNSNNDW